MNSLEDSFINIGLKELNNNNEESSSGQHHEINIQNGGREIG